MSTTQSTNISPLKQLEVILQGILSLAAVIYSLGFIVVNSYYTSFGVTDYQLIQTRYIAAGLSYLFFHVGIASMLATIVIVVDVYKRIMLELPRLSGHMETCGMRGTSVQGFVPIGGKIING